MTNPLETISALSIWNGKPEISALPGGLTNQNYLVTDEAGKFVVRLGGDIIEHQLMRFNELAASKAAHLAGLSPRVVYCEPGIVVLDYIQSRTLEVQDITKPEYFGRIVELIQTCHHEIPNYLRGPALVFWPFHVLRDYGWTLKEGESVHRKLLNELQEKADRIEKMCGAIDLVFGHNDLLAANILDDGERLWLLDWDYAGFNSPLFDLGGLASNNAFNEVQEKQLLEFYFNRPSDEEIWRRFQAMKCTSLLRETMWSMVSEIHSTLDFDYYEYTMENYKKFDQAYSNLLQLDT